MAKTRFFRHSNFVSLSALCAAFALFALASCQPLAVVTEPSGAERETGISASSAAQLSVRVNTDSAGGSTGGPSRSISPGQAASVVNYYEIIVNKLSGGAGSAPTAEFVSARAGAGSSMSVSVAKGAYYNVLFLAGYRPPAGGDLVLLRSAFAADVGPIVTGVNTVTLTLFDIAHDPVADAEVQTTPPIHAERDTRDTVLYMCFPQRRHISPSGGDFLAKVSGIRPLIDAGAGAGTFEARVNLLPWLKRGALGQWVPDKMWNNLPATSIQLRPDEAEAVWQFAQADFPGNDADAILRWDMTYYGFTRPASGTTPAWTASQAKAAGFTHWHIRNGLDDSFDFINTSGGSMFVRIGSGSGLYPGRDESGLVIHTLDTFDTAPRITLTPGAAGSGRIDVNLTPSVPPADTYDLYWISGKTSNPTVVKTGSSVTGLLATQFPYSISGLGSSDYSVIAMAKLSGYTDRNSNVAQAKTGEFVQKHSHHLESIVNPLRLKVVLDRPALPEPDTYEIYYIQGDYGEAAMTGMMTTITGTSATQGKIVVPGNAFPPAGEIISGLNAAKYSEILVAKKSGFTSGIEWRQIDLTATTFSPMPAISLTPGDKKLTVTLTTPASPAADSYSLYYVQGTQNESYTIGNCATPITGLSAAQLVAGYTIPSGTPNLTPGTNYTVVAVAKKSAYNDGISTRQTAMTLDLEQPVLTLTDLLPGLKIDITSPGNGITPVWDIYIARGTYSTESGVMANLLATGGTTTGAAQSSTHNLTGGETYSILAKARKAGGYTTQTSAIYTTTLQGLNAPLFTLTPGAGKLDVSITNATTAPAPTSWDVYIVQGSGIAVGTVTAAANKVATITAPATTYSITQLASGSGLTDTAYSVALIAKKTDYTDKPSAVQTGTPGGLAAPAFSLTAGAGKLDVSISVPTAAPVPTSWDVYVVQGSGVAVGTVTAAANKVATITAPTSTYSITQLASGSGLTETAYSVVLVAKKAGFTDKESLVLTGTPNGLNTPAFMLSPLPNRITVTITNATVAPAPTSWDVYIMQGNGQPLAMVTAAANKVGTITAPATTYTITSLANTIYSVAVVAKKAGFTDKASAVQSGTPDGLNTPMFTLTPGTNYIDVAVTNATATPAPDSWDVYVVQGDSVLIATVTAAANKVGTITAPATTFSITQLASGTALASGTKYTVALIAKKTGYTDNGSTMTAQTAIGLATPSFTLSGGPNKIDVSITLPTTAPVPTAYDIYYISGNVATATTVKNTGTKAGSNVPATSPTTDFAITGLTVGQVYSVVVVAKASGFSEVLSVSKTAIPTKMILYVDTTDADTESPARWSYGGGTYTIANGAEVTVSNKNSGTTNHVLTVASGSATTKITLDGARINASATPLNPNETRVELTLKGTNTLENTASGISGRPGILVKGGTVLTVTSASTGTLTAKGGDYSAGIGWCQPSKSGGKVVINGGTVNATGGIAGAGIGTALGGIVNGNTPMTVEITGGTVNATGGNGTESGVAVGGAGIGGSSAGGRQDRYFDITISGGTVTATGGQYCAGIGGGGNNNNGMEDGNGNITITGGSVTATGGVYAPGIGGGGSGSGVGRGVDSISITGSATGSATKGAGSNGNAIGGGWGPAGKGVCGSVTVTASGFSGTHD